MDAARPLSGFNQEQIERILAEAAGEVATSEIAGHDTRSTRMRRRYIIVLADYGLIDVAASGPIVPGGYPESVAVVGITRAGRGLLEELRRRDPVRKQTTCGTFRSAES